MIPTTKTGFLLTARNALIGVALASSGLWSADGGACSNLMMPVDNSGKDPAIVSARTLDFPLVDRTIIWNVTLKAFERNRAWKSQLFIGNKGKEWRNRYGFVAMTALEEVLHIVGAGPYSMDGLNEEGLSAAFLWLEGSEYPDFKGGVKQLLWVDTVNYILGRFKTVDEVKAAFTDPQNADYFTVGSYDFLSSLVPLHVIVHDKAGKSLLVEWIAGKQNIYTGADVDRVGVLTNEPEWPEQLINLNKQEYRRARPENEMMGLPGDSTPKSRFVRLAKLRQYANLQADRDYVQVAGHLINNVDVVHGTDQDPDFGDDYTGPTLIRDHKNRKLYFKGQNNQSFRVIDIGKIDFSQAGLENKGILADPTIYDPIYDSYQFAQDVTAMLTGAKLDWDGTAADAKILNVTVSISAQELLKLPVRMRYGSMFVYAVTPDQEFFQWWNNGWTPVTNGLLAPTYTGKFATRTFRVNLNKLPLSEPDRYGTKIYAGWGTSGTEMLLAQRQNLVFVIGDFREYQVDP